MTLSTLLKQGTKVVADHAPALLTAFGVSGTVTTAVLASKASYRASEIIHADEDGAGTAGTFKQRWKERIPLVWRLYIPPVTTGVVTVGAIICANRISTKRAAAAYSLLTMTQQAFSEYREEITEVIGPKKEEAARDNIVQKKVEGASPEIHNILVRENQQLCCEMHTGRYFASDMQTIRKGMNDLNAQLIDRGWATLDDWYYIAGLESTQFSDNWGWTTRNGLLDLKFTSALTRDGKPVLAFTYNYLIPIHQNPCDHDDEPRPDS